MPASLNSGHSRVECWMSIGLSAPLTMLRGHLSWSSGRLAEVGGEQQIARKEHSTAVHSSYLANGMAGVESACSDGFRMTHGLASLPFQ
ncbi:hypothetical protein HNY73_018271 [Argiope bruennichi]|uniref:Uncharacterized protein n=1 Tax=Argiope bruennichi TaxID=94029 RepID=A0A8T0ECC1_ARGBR|nr:hypothetical protein HNY73_018271 [Argiope bruennichi]